MLTALETTRIATSSEITSSAIIMSLAQGLMAETSVGLNAVAVVNEKPSANGSRRTHDRRGLVARADQPSSRIAEQQVDAVAHQPQAE